MSGHCGGEAEGHCRLNDKIHEGNIAHSVEEEPTFSVDMTHFHGNKKHSESDYNTT